MARRVVTNPEVLQGKPILEGTRISVTFVLEMLSSGMTVDQIVEEYPHLAHDDVIAAVIYAKQVVDGEDIMPSVEAA
jgi:uncharacterized protein (DUF433 family)